MDREQGIKLMQDLLRRVVEKKASDLFVTAGFPPAIKIDGEVRPQSELRAAPRGQRVDRRHWPQTHPRAEGSEVPTTRHCLVSPFPTHVRCGRSLHAPGRKALQRISKLWR